MSISQWLEQAGAAIDDYRLRCSTWYAERTLGEVAEEALELIAPSTMAAVKEHRRLCSTWYVDHTYLDTVEGALSDTFTSATAALEPYAVPAIGRNLDWLDRTVHQILLSRAMGHFAGGFSVSGTLFLHLTAGLPTLVNAVYHEGPGLLLEGANRSIVEGGDLVVDYANGRAPADPYQASREAGLKLGALILLGAGIRAGVGGISGGMKALANVAEGGGRGFATNEGVVVAGADEGALTIDRPMTDVGRGISYSKGSDEGEKGGEVIDTEVIDMQKVRARQDGHRCQSVAKPKAQKGVGSEKPLTTKDLLSEQEYAEMEFLFGTKTTPSRIEIWHTLKTHLTGSIERIFVDGTKAEILELIERSSEGMTKAHRSLLAERSFVDSVDMTEALQMLYEKRPDLRPQGGGGKQM